MHLNYDDLQYQGISDLKHTFDNISITMMRSYLLVHLKEPMKDIE